VEPPALPPSKIRLDRILYQGRVAIIMLRRGTDEYHQKLGVCVCESVTCYTEEFVSGEGWGRATPG